MARWVRNSFKVWTVSISIWAWNLCQCSCTKLYNLKLLMYSFIKYDDPSTKSSWSLGSTRHIACTGHFYMGSKYSHGILILTIPKQLHMNTSVHLDIMVWTHSSFVDPSSFSFIAHHDPRLPDVYFPLKL